MKCLANAQLASDTSKYWDTCYSITCGPGNSKDVVVTVATLGTVYGKCRYWESHVQV